LSDQRTYYKNSNETAITLTSLIVCSYAQEFYEEVHSLQHWKHCGNSGYS